MTFQEKINKILDTNELGIDSINRLEKEIGASTGSINKYYNKNKQPGPATVKKIKKKLGIDDTSWKTGEFNLSSRKKEPTAKELFDQAVQDELKKGMLDQLYKDLDNQSRHLDKALDLVARLLPPAHGVESVATKDR